MREENKTNNCNRWNEIRALLTPDNLSISQQNEYQDHLFNCDPCFKEWTSITGILLETHIVANPDEIDDQDFEDETPILVITQLDQAKRLRHQSNINVVMWTQIRETSQRFIHLWTNKDKGVDHDTKPLSKSKKQFPFMWPAFRVAAAFLFIITLSWHANRTTKPLSPTAEKLQLILVNLDKPVTPTQDQYQLLHDQLNYYLAARRTNNKTDADRSIQAAKNIANNISKTGDQTGIDLINFYQSMPDNSIPSLQEARGIINELNTNIFRDDYSTAVSRAITARDVFQAHNAEIEVEQSEAIIARLYGKLSERARSQYSINKYLEKTAVNKHLYIRAQLLHWQGENLSSQSQFTAAIESLEASMAISRKIYCEEFFLKSSTAAASIYFVTDDNQKALEKGLEILTASKNSNQLTSIQLFQVIGMSAYNLGYVDLAEQYIDYSINLAIARKMNPYLAISYSMMGIIKGEQRKSDAQISFIKSFSALNEIPDLQTKSMVDFAVSGYYARIELFNGNPVKALSLYNRSLEIAERYDIRQKLSLAQIHQGLGECYIAIKDNNKARSLLEKAVELEAEGRAQSEEINSFMRFVVTRQSAAEQLRTLPN